MKELWYWFKWLRFSFRTWRLYRNQTIVSDRTGITNLLGPGLMKVADMEGRIELVSAIELTDEVIDAFYNNEPLFYTKLSNKMRQAVWDLKEPGVVVLRWDSRSDG